MKFDLFYYLKELQREKQRKRCLPPADSLHIMAFTARVWARLEPSAPSGVPGALQGQAVSRELAQRWGSQGTD